jgi:hypothetical protein
MTIMVAKKSTAKRAVEALLGDAPSALTFADGILFDVAFDGIRRHQQQRDAAKGKSKRSPWAEALAAELAAAHPDLPTVRLTEDEFLPQDEQDRRYAGFVVWLGEDDKRRRVLMADKYGAHPSQTKPITVTAFKREYLGPAHRRVKERHSEKQPKRRGRDLRKR